MKVLAKQHQYKTKSTMLKTAKKNIIAYQIKEETLRGKGKKQIK